MAYLNNLLAKVRSLDINSAADAAAEQTEESLVEKQKEQWAAGIGSDGKPLGELAWPEYAVEKFESGNNPYGTAPFGQYDLYNEGDFYQDAFAESRNGVVEIGSTNEKTQKIEALTDGRTFGLASEAKAEYLTDEFGPALIRNISAQIGLPYAKTK